MRQELEQEVSMTMKTGDNYYTNNVNPYFQGSLRSIRYNNQEELDLIEKAIEVIEKKDDLQPVGSLSPELKEKITHLTTLNSGTPAEVKVSLEALKMTNKEKIAKQFPDVHDLDTLLKCNDVVNILKKRNVTLDQLPDGKKKFIAENPDQARMILDKLPISVFLDLDDYELPLVHNFVLEKSFDENYDIQSANANDIRASIGGRIFQFLPILETKGVITSADFPSPAVRNYFFTAFGKEIIDLKIDHENLPLEIDDKIKLLKLCPNLKKLEIAPNMNVVKFIAEDPQFENLEDLTVGVGLDSEILNDLMNSQTLRNLNKLELGQYNLTEESAKIIANSKLNNLSELGLNLLTYAANGIGAILDSNTLTLKKLKLTDFRLDVASDVLNEEKLKSVLKSKMVKELESLSLKTIYSAGSFENILAEIDPLPKLKSLDLSGALLRRTDLSQFTNSKNFTELQELNLSGNNLSDADLQVIADSENFKKLRVLDLTNNPHLTEAGITSIVDSPHLQNLREILVDKSLPETVHELIKKELRSRVFIDTR